MATLEKSEVALPPAETWNLLIDLAAWPKWMPRIKSVPDSLTGRDLKEGNTIAVVGGPPAWKPFVIIERVEPLHVLTFRAEIRPFYQVLAFLGASSFRAIHLTWKIEPKGHNSKVTVTAALESSLLSLIFGSWLLRFFLTTLKGASSPYQKAFVKYVRSSVSTS